MPRFWLVVTLFLDAVPLCLDAAPPCLDTAPRFLDDLSAVWTTKFLRTASAKETPLLITALPPFRLLVILLLKLLSPPVIGGITNLKSRPD